MSAIAGAVGSVRSDEIERMLEAVAVRGDQTDVATSRGAVFGLRSWKGRPGKAQKVRCAPDGRMLVMAGTLAPIPPDPAEALEKLLDERSFERLDGAFAAARWSPETGELLLIRDPFGIRPLFWVEHRGGLFFATELKQLLQIEDLPREVDLRVIHRYLTFSFVPGEEMPLRSVRSLPAGHLLRWCNGHVTIEPWFTLHEQIEVTEQAEAARRVWRLGLRAVQRRLEEPAPDGVGLYLSGGLDSSAVGVWLRELSVKTRCFTLDFGDQSVEREEAREVARALGFPLEIVPALGEHVLPVLDELVWKLDLPFGDPVTGPHLLLAKAARAHGLSVVFNGEGGDQLFGGWTCKPMIAAALYGEEEESPEQQYLRSYHRFYGMEEELYTPELLASIGEPGQRRALVAPYLHGGEAFLNRVRLTDLHLKGSQNILPRAERVSNGTGLDMRVPLFDRLLAEESFRIAPHLKLHGACEKYVLKLAMQNKLPERIVWRRKYGMSVPVTDLVLGPLSPWIGDLLSDEAVRRRGWFRPEAVRALREGHDRAGETRRRRLGERLWALAMLEAWARRMLDRRSP